MNYTTISQCRLCAGSIKRVMDFGLCPLANSYPFIRTDHEDLFPLSVAKCVNCGHVQLEQTVSPDILFKNYLYSSSDSAALVAHIAELSRYAQRFMPRMDCGILEIGCNDGILLNAFASAGFTNLHGVDPAENLINKAEKSGAKLHNGFFTPKLAADIRAKDGPMALIISTNTFAHVADLDGLVNGIRVLLAPGGVFVFENAYLGDTIKNGYFDQIYHEHLQYYGIRPLVGFFARHGLKILDIEHLSTQGGSIRVAVVRLDSPAYATTAATVARWVAREEEDLLYDDATYSAFVRNLDASAEGFAKFVSQVADSGATISCYGCPAKFALLSKVFGLTADYVVDDSPLKQWRYSPGRKIRIVDNAHFQKHPTDYCVITAWNMADSIKKRNPQYQGKWVTPFEASL